MITYALSNRWNPWQKGALSKILEHDVTTMDENAVAEELLFVENIAVTYDLNTKLVLHTDKKKPKSD